MNQVFKSSGDTAVLSWLHEDSDPSSYFNEVQSFVQWSNDHHLIMVKTEEMSTDLKSLFIHDQKMKQVCSHRYLDVPLDNLFI